MVKIEVELQNETGLHARPASMFVKESSKYKSDVMIEKSGKKVNGKSIMGILSLGAGKNDMIIIEAEGEDEKEGVEALINLIRNNFSE